jgi:uncharacterized protein involved in exopolysaccharide biosynthesis
MAALDQNIVNSVEEDEVNLLDLLQVAADNLRLLVLGPVVAGLVALGIGFSITPTFTAATKFLPPQQQQSSAAAMLQSLGALGGLAGAATGLKNPADQHVAFVKSQTIQNTLIERFKLKDRYDAEDMHEARIALERNTRVSAGAKDGLITIEVEDKDPAFSAQLANAYVEEFQKLLDRLAVTEAQQRRLFFERQLAATKSNLAKAEQALKGSGLNSSALKTNPQAAVEGLARLKAYITAQEIKLASMRGYLTDNAPEFRQAQNELSAMRAQLRLAEKEEPSNGRSPEESDYVAKFRDFKYQETLFELFAKQYEIARIDEGREGAVIQVLDEAKPPEKKSKPKKALIATATALATGFLLLLWIFVRNAVRNASQDPESSVKLARIRRSFRRALGQGECSNAG